MDPISAAVAGGFGLLTSLFGQGNAPQPTPPPAPPAPARPPEGTPSTNKPPSAPSFLAGAAAPNQNQMGGKTLLGQ